MQAPFTLSPTHPSFPRRACPVLDTGREPRGAAGAVPPQPTPLTLSPAKPSFPAKAGIQRGGGGRSTAANPARAEPVLSTAEGSVHPEPSSTVIPAKAGIQRGGGGRSTTANSAHPEPAEGPQDKLGKPRTRRTRTQRRRDGAARAATLGKRSKRNNEEKQDKPAPAELTIAERRINEKLEQHRHEPDPYGGPIDSTHPGRSPPW